MPPLFRRLLLVAIVAALAYCGLAFFGEVGPVMLALGDLRPALLAHCLVWATLNYLIRHVRWVLYLRALKIDVPPVASAIVFIAGFAMSITPGKVGELLKSAMLKERYDVPLARSGPIVVAERVTDLAGLAILIAMGATDFPGGTWITLAAVAVVLAILIVCAVPAIANLLLALLELVPAIRQRSGRLREAYGALQETSTPAVFLAAVALSTLSWATHGVVLWLLAGNYAELRVDLIGSMFAYSAPLLAGTLALLPGGLGVTELSMAGILTLWSVDGSGKAAAASVTIAVRGLTFWWAILLGVLALVAWRVRGQRD